MLLNILSLEKAYFKKNKVSISFVKLLVHIIFSVARSLAEVGVEGNDPFSKLGMRFGVGRGKWSQLRTRNRCHPSLKL